VFDVIVVGGGSAGCVLAARLSEDGGRRVLLIEAGADYPTVADLPRDIADASTATLGHDWGFLSEPDELGRILPLARARVMGGCSATNACFALRGSPSDYDGWARLGNPGWSFEEVLPFFCNLETDQDFNQNWHGADGPIPIRRDRPDELSPVQAAFIEAAQACGHRYVDDHNRSGAVGVGPIPRNARAGLRMSSAVTYLAAARDRPNLTIRSNEVVDRVELSHARAAGVRLAGGETIPAGLVVLAAGTYASPGLLIRSGLGPVHQMSNLGIDVVVDLPGVGENLIDHPMVAVDLPTMAPGSAPRFQAVATVRSGSGQSDGPPDIHLYMSGPWEVGAQDSPTGAVSGIVAGLLSPQSVGRVYLRSADPLASPVIETAHLTHPDDLALMVRATQIAREISRAEPLAGLVFGPEVAPGPGVADDDLDGLAQSIKERVSTYHHPVATCRMGPDPGQGAVVDARGKVYGTERLHVADASIMPAIPSANTNLPTIMVAERIADWLTG
jgi:choline dehydrogenase